MVIEKGYIKDKQLRGDEKQELKRLGSGHMIKEKVQDSTGTGSSDPVVHLDLRITLRAESQY